MSKRTPTVREVDDLEERKTYFSRGQSTSFLNSSSECLKVVDTHRVGEISAYRCLQDADYMAVLPILYHPGGGEVSPYLRPLADE